MAEPVILFRDVSFSYGRVKVLDRFSLSVEKGERVCLFGPSGCGKSTVLRLICGLEKPDSGDVRVTADTVRPVFQEDRLLPFLTVQENAAMFAHGAETDTLLSALGLSEAKDELPARLSGGMARRAAIARALAGAGDLYVMDEPFNGLDENNTAAAVRLIAERTEGKTLVCILHSRADALRLGCRIVEMETVSR